jgi:LysM repeat protein
MKGKITKMTIQGSLVGLLGLLIITSLVMVSLPGPAAAATCVANYTVQSGDTITSIAASYNVDWRALADANNLKEPYTIVVGQKLCIPAGATVATATPSTGTTIPANKYFTITPLVNYFVNIKTAKLAKTTPYIVRVWEPDGKMWIRIGRVRTDKNGASNKALRLPKALRDDTLLNFCLKNSWTDAVQCQWVDMTKITK